MKINLLFLLGSLIVISCGNTYRQQGRNGEPPQMHHEAPEMHHMDHPVTHTSQNLDPDDPELMRGRQLIESQKCFTCHRISDKLIGPAYIEIAKKYEDSPDVKEQLAKRIIDGSSGVWGQVPMTPHPHISMDTAKLMVSYILSLDK